jgi:ABC-type sugar transport system substrate-binding protein
MTKGTWYRAMVVPAVAALGVTVAACGSSGSSGNSGTSTSAAASSQVQVSTPKPITNPPTSVGITRPMNAAPQQGKTFFWLQCELPICEKITQGVKAATTAAGWKYQNLVFKASDPGAGLQSAIQRKPDAIGITGIPSAAIKPQLAAAAKAGIPVVTCSAGPEQPSPTTYAAICSHTTGPDGVNQGLWAIHDSGGKANIVNVTIPSFPSLAATVNGTADAVKQHCPKCSTDTLNLTVDDLGGGQVASKLVAYLQSHPKVNYVLFTFADLANGVPEALKAAGLADKVTLVGNGGGEAQFKAVAGGAHEAWVAYPAELEGWQMTDAAIRIVDGGKLPSGYQQQIEHLPTYIIDTPASAKKLAPTYDWSGPAGYAQQFKKLWKLTG